MYIGLEVEFGHKLIEDDRSFCRNMYYRLKTFVAFLSVTHVSLNSWLAC